MFLLRRKQEFKSVKPCFSSSHDDHSRFINPRSPEIQALKDVLSEWATDNPGLVTRSDPGRRSFESEGAEETSAPAAMEEDRVGEPVVGEPVEEPMPEIHAASSSGSLADTMETLPMDMDWPPRPEVPKTSLLRWCQRKDSQARTAGCFCVGLVLSPSVCVFRSLVMMTLRRTTCQSWRCKFER